MDLVTVTRVNGAHLVELGFRHHPRGEGEAGGKTGDEATDDDLVCALALVACSSQYIMSTKDGKMITDSKPKLDEHRHTAITIPKGGR